MDEIWADNRNHLTLFFFSFFFFIICFLFFFFFLRGSWRQEFVVTDCKETRDEFSPCSKEPSGHTTLKWRHINVDAMSWIRIDVDMTYVISTLCAHWEGTEIVTQKMRLISVKQWRGRFRWNWHIPPVLKAFKIFIG